MRDPSDHGPLAKIVSGRIAALDVTWSDKAVFRTNRAVEEFLARLLTRLEGSTYTHVPWAQRLGAPAIVAAVRHTEGESGSWRIWYSWPSIYCVYRDGRGRWWFGHWFNVDTLRLNPDRPGAK